MNMIFAMLPAFVTRDPLPYAFLFLLLFGFITPICEEIAVAFVGVTMKATNTRFLPAIAVALAAILIQDTAFYFAARLFGEKIIRHKLLARLIKPKNIEDGERYFTRRGPFIVFSSRFVVGLRATVIISAGLLRMRWSRFALYDFFAAAIMTPAWLFIGFALGSQFDRTVGHLTKILSIMGPVAILIGALLIYRSVKADKAKVDAEPFSSAGREPASRGSSM